MDIDQVAVRLLALKKAAATWLKAKGIDYFKAEDVIHLFQQYALLRDDLRLNYPKLFEDLPVRKPLVRCGSLGAFLLKAIKPDLDLPGNIARGDLDLLTKDIDHCLNLVSYLKEHDVCPELPSVFRRQGPIWTIAYNGHQFPLGHMKGLSYISHLIQHPGREFHVLDLVRIVEGSLIGEIATEIGPREAADNGLQESHRLGNCGPMIDQKAEQEYKRRIEDLRSELGVAESNRDSHRAGEIQEEIDFIERELARAYGLGRHRTKASGAAEKARKSVTYCIRASIDRIRDEHQSLGQHLSNAIRTGVFCSYSPSERIEWRV